MKDNPIPYKRQIFVCTNDQKGEKPSCGDHQGEAIFRALRQIAKDRGLHPKIRVAQAKCLGQCAQGANIMIFPEQKWFSCVKVEEVQSIADQFIREEL